MLGRHRKPGHVHLLVGLDPVGLEGLYRSMVRLHGCGLCSKDLRATQQSADSTPRTTTSAVIAQFAPLGTWMASPGHQTPRHQGPGCRASWYRLYLYSDSALVHVKAGHMPPAWFLGFGFRFFRRPGFWPGFGVLLFWRPGFGFCFFRTWARLPLRPPPLIG